MLNKVVVYPFFPRLVKLMYAGSQEFIDDALNRHKIFKEFDRNPTATDPAPHALRLQRPVAINEAALEERRADSIAKRYEGSYGKDATFSGVIGEAPSLDEAISTYIRICEGNIY